MYTLPKGPTNKLSMNARRGPPRQLEFDCYYTREKPNGEGYYYDHQPADMSNPKPTFQPKKPGNKWRSSQYNQNAALHPNHLEMANLLCRQWKKVMEGSQKGSVEETTYVFYMEKEPIKNLSGFQPFDLEKLLWSKQTSRNVLGKPPN